MEAPARTSIPTSTSSGRALRARLFHSIRAACATGLRSLAAAFRAVLSWLNRSLRPMAKPYEARSFKR